MKKLTLSIVAVIAAVILFGQTPQSFKYQTVVRDNTGEIITDQPVSFRNSIRKDSINGDWVYIETHIDTTNQFGLVTLEIGNGLGVSGVFEDIDWGDGLYFLRIRMDATGGTNYQLMGTTQLMSVPYALYAESSGDAGAAEINELTDAKTTGNSLYLGLGAGAIDNSLDNKNVGVGNGSLAVNTSGDFNAANGLQTLYYNTTGNRNTANGYRALFSNTVGTRNTATGYQALYYNIDGEWNTAIGSGSLLENTTGNNNTAIGFLALNRNTIGNNNTTIGRSVNYYNQEGSNNTMVGFQAGMGTTNHTKSGNIFLGYQAGFHETGDNKLYIENSLSTSPLIYGDLENDILAFNANVGIGTNNPNSWAKLDVRGNLSVNGNTYINHSDATESILDIYNSVSDWELVAASDDNRFDIRKWGGIPALCILGNSFIGMGITNPIAKLDIRGDSMDDGAIVSIGNSDHSHRLSFYPGRENDPNPFIQWKEGDPLRFSTDETGWSEKMRIQSNGNVGIGTDIPTTRLDIRGDNPDDEAILSIGNSDGTHWIRLFGGRQNYANPYIQWKSGDPFRFATDETGWSEKMRITSDGWVGIGTINPAGILDVAGEYHFPNVDGMIGQVLRTDGSGVLSWSNAAAGVAAINDLTDGKTGGNSVFLGSGAGINDNGSDNQNIAIGVDALNTTIIGAQNIAIGKEALFSNVGGAWNVAIGNQALNSNSGGAFNTAVGTQALFNSDNYDNTGIGYQALFSNTSGMRNSAVGSYVSFENTTGQRNTSMGCQANYYNQEGSYNTIIGYEAGKGDYTHNKEGNVFLGYQAGWGEYGNNKLYIENSGSETPLIYGEFDTDLVRIYGTLDINNTFKFPTIDGLNGQVLETDGSGQLSWVTYAGGSVNYLDDLMDAKTDDSNVFIGAGAGLNDTGNNFNTTTGKEALYSNTNGEQNSAFGNRALFYNTIGESNIANGFQALYGHNGGHEGMNNIAIGKESLFSNFNGDHNIANGERSLYYNHGGISFTGPWGTYKEGSFNIATGTEAMFNNEYGAYNIAMGYQALYTNTGYGAEREVGDYNTAIGYQALYNTKIDGYTGSMIACYNTGIGHEVLYNNTSGNGNNALGYQAGKTSVDGNYNTFLGHSADASSGSIDNAIAIGYNAIVNASNKVRIGNSSVTVIEGEVDFTYTSDKNKKENFHTIEGEQVLQKIRQFNLQSWNYKHDTEKIRHYGPVAQDFFSAFGHDSIGTIGSDTTLCGSDVVGINMVAIQTLEKRTSELKSENEQLKRELFSLKSEMAKFKSLLHDIEELSIINKLEDQNHFAKSK